MAKQASGLKISKASLTKLAVCSGIVVAFVALLILPSIMADKDAKRDILRMQAELEKQKILYPLYLKLHMELNSKVVQELPIPVPEALTEDQIVKATHTVEDLAMQAGLTINEVTPDPVSLTKSSGYVGVNCDFYGKYMDFRSFLTKLGSVPYLKHIEKIELQEGADGIGYLVRLQLAVKTG